MQGVWPRPQPLAVHTRHGLPARQLSYSWRMATPPSPPRPWQRTRGWPTAAAAYAAALGICLSAVLVAWPLAQVLDTASLVLIFMLAVVLAGAWLGRGPAVLAAVAAVLLFNLLFVPPRFSLAVADERLLFTLAVMGLVGLIGGHLTASLRGQARAAAAGESLVRNLYDISRELGNALSVQQVDETARRFFLTQLDLQTTLWVCHPRWQRVSPEAVAPALEQRALALVAASDGGATVSNDEDLLPLRGPMALRGVLHLQRRRAAGWHEGERPLVAACAALIGSALERIHYVDVARDSAVDIEGERLRNALLSAISHDLRTPLAALVGLAESLLLTRPPPTPEQSDMARAMAASARRMGAMANNLLDLARIESGAVRLRLEWLPMEEVLGAALAATGAILARHHTVIEVPDGMPLCRLDPVLVERVLVNLLENAAKYTPAGSTITLSARASDGALCLSVSDNGPGLPGGRPADLLRKFERGARESATAGVGLGLALCDAIVRAHGGRLGAGQSPAGGARFELVFPLPSPPDMPPDGSADGLAEAAVDAPMERP